MKFKVLEMLLNDDSFISGEEIGNRLNISRAAVSKNVSRLKEMGYSIEAVNNKGYHLDKNYDLLNVFELKNGLETKFLGHEAIYFDEIGSTNDEAKKRALDSEKAGFLVFSDFQNAGKGRLGRTWNCEKGAALYFSFILRPDIMPYEAPLLTLVAGIGVMKAIKKITGFDVKIKWPNDIVVNGKKIVGILTEMNAEIEQIKYVVVGIGININNSVFDEEISYKATSLKIEANKSFSRIKILQQCLSEIEKSYLIFEKNGFSALRQEYKDACINMGMDVKLMLKNEEIIGKAVDINENGEIVVEKKSGERINVFGGEVSLRRADGKYI